MTHDTSQPSLTFRSKLEERLVFFFVCMGIVTVTYGFFALIDFLPEKPGTEKNETAPLTVFDEDSVFDEDTFFVDENIPLPDMPDYEGQYPTQIIFDSLGNKEVTVLNPESSDINVLDNALLRGAVRHPASADFVDTGTMFILGHSSYLPQVNNRNYQAFNGIQKLVWGDTIRVRSATKEYVYSVSRVYEAKATDTEVPITFGESKLILATCNSFGTTDDRFVVEATFVSVRTL